MLSVNHSARRICSYIRNLTNSSVFFPNEFFKVIKILVHEYNKNLEGYIPAARIK